MKHEYIHVLEAVNIVLGWQPRENVQSKYILGLADRLQDRYVRGEFDGTMEDAFVCLEDENE